MQLHMSSYIFIYLYISSCFFIYLHITSSIFIYLHISSYIFIYLHISSYIFIYLHLSSYIFIYLHISHFHLFFLSLFLFFLSPFYFSLSLFLISFSLSLSLSLSLRLALSFFVMLNLRQFIFSIPTRLAKSQPPHQSKNRQRSFCFQSACILPSFVPTRNLILAQEHSRQRQASKIKLTFFLRNFFSCDCLMASMARSVECLIQNILDTVQVHLIGAAPIVQLKK